MAYTRRGFKGGCAATTLTADASSGSTSLVCDDLTTWAGVSTTGPFGFTISRGHTDEEQCQATGISGNNLIGVTRGVGGTVAQAHVAGATVEHTTLTMDFDEANAHLSTTSLDHHTQYARTDGSRVITGGTTISIGSDGTSLHITKSAASLNSGSILISRDGTNENQSIVFDTGVSRGFCIGRVGNDDSLYFSTWDGSNLTHRFVVAPTGGVFGIGQSHYFGAFADSVTAGARVQIGGHAGGGAAAILWAEGNGADHSLNFRSKGSGLIELQNSAGTNLLTASADGAVTIGHSTNGILSLPNTLGVSASASAGPNVLPANVGGFVSILLLGGIVKIPYYPA